MYLTADDIYNVHVFGIKLETIDHHFRALQIQKKFLSYQGNFCIKFYAKNETHSEGTNSFLMHCEMKFRKKVGSWGKKQRMAGCNRYD